MEASISQETFQLAPKPEAWVTLEGVEDLDDPNQKFWFDKTRRATRRGGNDKGRFNIDLKFLVTPTDEQAEIFDQAAGRWENIIIRDIPSITGTIPSAFEGLPPAVDGTVDDLLIEVVLAPIDGPGGILGQAGPVFVRTDGFLPITGVMFFDVADLAVLEELELFDEVIIHEMGHVLGVGTLWDAGDRDLLRNEETNPYFSGRLANLFWKIEGGTKKLPVEDMGGPGTRLGHWRESVLDNELMTGFLNLGENPLSSITASSLRDLGYGAIPFGDRYDLPEGASGVDPNGDVDSDPAGDQSAGVDIATGEILLTPIGSVTTK
jgi:hypothetical protein